MIAVELTLTTSSATHWAIIRETAQRLLPELRPLASMGNDARGRPTYRLHLTRGTTDPRSWRSALVALASLADEGEV